MRFKNHHFAHEREWRLCLLLDESEFSLCQYRDRAAERVPYAAIRLKPRDPTLRISEIVIGPCGRESRVKTVQDLVAKYQIENCRVSRSDAPYRSL